VFIKFILAKDIEMANVFIILRDRDDKKSSDVNKRRQIPLQSLYDLKAFSSNECDKNLMVS